MQLIINSIENLAVGCGCSILVLTKIMVFFIAAATAKSPQSCPTLCDPIDGSPPGSSVPGILQARTLEWVTISFSNAWNWKVKVKSLSCVRLLAAPWTADHQAPPSMGFSRQEYWSGVPLPSPREQVRRQIFVCVCVGLHISTAFRYCGSCAFKSNDESKLFEKVARYPSRFKIKWIDPWSS